MRTCDEGRLRSRCGMEEAAAMPRRQAADLERVGWVVAKDEDPPSPYLGFPTSASAPAPPSKQAAIRRQLHLQYSSLFSHPHVGNN